MQKTVYPMQSSFKCCTFLIAAFLLGFTALGQETKVVDIHAPNINDQYNGVYYKDLNGIYDPYLGVWTGAANGRLFEFHIVKFNQVRYEFTPGKFHFNDELRIKFSVKDIATNFILYSSLNSLGIDDYPIYGDIVPQFALFYFKDTTENCRNKAQFFLENVVGNPNQLLYAGYSLLGTQTATCSYASAADIPMFLPTQNLILTKQ